MTFLKPLFLSQRCCPSIWNQGIILDGRKLNLSCLEKKEGVKEMRKKKNKRKQKTKINNKKIEMRRKKNHW